MKRMRREGVKLAALALSILLAVLWGTAVGGRVSYTDIDAARGCAASNCATAASC